LLGSPLSREQRAFDLLRRPEVSYDELDGVLAADTADWRDDERLTAQVPLQADVQAKYMGYIDRQHDEIERQRRNEETLLPATIDYARVRGLSNEVRQKLIAQRPATLGQAARIPGMTPAAVSLLLIHLKREPASTAESGTTVPASQPRTTATATQPRTTAPATQAAAPKGAMDIAATTARTGEGG
jgi:tRNA uridine 5-carboxymethylaminomethyl modification enzyme